GLGLLFDHGTVWQLDFFKRTFGDAVTGNIGIGNFDGGQATPGCRIFDDAAGLSNNFGDLNIGSPGDFYLFSINFDGLVLNAFNDVLFNDHVVQPLNGSPVHIFGFKAFFKFNRGVDLGHQHIIVPNIGGGLFLRRLCLANFAVLKGGAFGSVTGSQSQSTDQPEPQCGTK